MVRNLNSVLRTCGIVHLNFTTKDKSGMEYTVKLASGSCPSDCLYTCSFLTISVCSPLSFMDAGKWLVRELTSTLEEVGVKI